MIKKKKANRAVPKKQNNKKWPLIIAAIVIILATEAYIMINQGRIEKAREDNRMDSDVRVIGLMVNGTPFAYVYSQLPEATNDALNGIPVLIVKYNDRVSVFERRINGRVLEFSLSGNVLIDSNSRRWPLDGKSRVGNLTAIESRDTQWYLWLAEHNDTEIRNLG
jgi:hypothetical protein